MIARRCGSCGWLGYRSIGWGMMILWLASSGCARLDIGVDVYKGDLLMPDDSKLAKAVAVARQAYEFSQAYTRKKKVQDDRFESYLTRVMQVYQDEKIDLLWSKYEEAEAAYVGAGAPPTTTGTSNNTKSQREQLAAAARKRLGMAVSRFGNACIITGQERGLGEVIVQRSIADILLPVPIAGMVQTRIVATADYRLTLGFLLEESGRYMVNLVADVDDASQRRTIARLMQSATQGILAEAIQRGIAAKVASVPETLQTLNWSSINNIHVEGVGKEEFVVVKDEIGNWHIKSARSDPQDVVNAVFDTTAGIVNVVAQHYGISLNQNSSTGAQQTSGSNATTDAEVKSAAAEDVIAKLKSQRQKLDQALEHARTIAAKQPAEALSVAKAAAKLYSDQVNEIEFELTNPANTGSSSTPSSGTTTPAPAGSSPKPPGAHS